MDDWSSSSRQFDDNQGSSAGLHKTGSKHKPLNKSQRQRSQSKECLKMSDLRIVLLGKNVSENSRVRNTILEIDVHESDAPTGLQQHCVRISGAVKNRHITVINTFHLLNPNISDDQITQTVRECVSLSDPGPHVFILVLQNDDFTPRDMRRVKHVLNKFSEEAIKCTILITTVEETHDSHMFSPIENNTAIHQLIKECGGRHLQLEERKPEWRSEIFRNVDEMLKGNQEEYVAGPSTIKELSRLFENKQRSYNKDDGKLKQSKRSEESLISANSSKKQKLNLVLCGSDGSLTVSVSKLLRDKKINPSHQRVSNEVCVKKEKIHGYKISLMELPALSRLSEEEVMRQTLCCVSLCDPGVHVFLFIINFGRLTNDDKAEIEMILKNFYPREHLIVICIHDGTVDRAATDLIKQSPECQSLISRCGGQYRVMSLKESENSRQIPELLDYIENMKIEPYSAQMYVKAQENRVRRETEENYKEKLKKMETEIKELKKKIHSEGADSEFDDQECLRIVLIGRTGSGKSATGNTILGREKFQSQLRPDSVTTDCQKRVGEVNGRSVAVVDTPGLFDTTLSNELVVEEIVKCVSLSSPGPHVFVIVLSLGRFTKEETDTVDLIKKIFGPKSAQFSIVLFTRGDELENASIKQYVENCKSAELKKLMRDCGNRFLVFNNKEKQDKTQVIQLLNMIEEVKKTNEGRYFTNSMFEEAEMSIKKRMEEIMKEREREIQTQKEELQTKYEMEKKNLMMRLKEEKQRADEERKKMEDQYREKEEKLRRESEEREKTEQKIREIENQKRSEEEKQQRAEYHQKIEEMKREIENQRSQYEKQQKEREEHDRKRKEKYRQDEEKMKNEKERIIVELRMKQEEEIKKRELEEKRRIEEEDKERQKWEIKIKEAENDRKEIQEEIKRQQREWEDEKKRKMSDREEEERKRKQRHDEQLIEKQEEQEKIRKKFEKEKEEERHKIEEERQKQRREREEKEREYEEKKTEMKRYYERLEQERKAEWERRKRDDEERREEEKKRWKKMIEDLKQEQEEEIKRREREEKERKDREDKDRNEMKQKHEEEIKVMKKKHEDEARKQAEELKDCREKSSKELNKMLEDDQEKYETLEKVYEQLKQQKTPPSLLKQLEKLLNVAAVATQCVIQ